MLKVARLSIDTVGLLGGAICLGFGYAYTAEYPAFIGSCILSWMGGIQLLNSAAPKLPLKIGRIIHWSNAMTFEVFALAWVGIMRLVPAREKVNRRKGRPILLVHGYVNHSSVWTFQKQHLEAAGLGPIFTINLGHPFRSIRYYAEKVQEKAEAIAKETGRNDLILIGHSMGGLVSCWYATQLAQPNTVTDIITIGSPFSGTPVARIGLGPNAREMERNSLLLTQLQAAISLNRQVRFYHIATKSDQLVIPGYTAAIPTNPHFLFEDMGHASLLYSTRVTKKICEWLTANDSMNANSGPTIEPL